MQKLHVVRIKQDVIDLIKKHRKPEETVNDVLKRLLFSDQENRIALNPGTLDLLDGVIADGKTEENQ